MIKRVTSLDPGGTTGIVTALITEARTAVVVRQHPFTESELYTELTFGKPDYIICETFEYRNKSRAGLVLRSRDLIGIVNLYDQTHDECRLFMQSPAQAKGFFTNDKLKKMEIYPVGVPHGRDALRHFMYWYMFAYGAKYNKQQPIVLA